MSEEESVLDKRQEWDFIVAGWPSEVRKADLLLTEMEKELDDMLEVAIQQTVSRCKRYSQEHDYPFTTFPLNKSLIFFNRAVEELAVQDVPAGEKGDFRTALTERFLKYLDDMFKDYFIKGDNSLSSLYDLLSMNLNEPEAIEEFLVAAHQKEPLRLSVSTELNHCDGDDGNTSYSLILNRSTWGYTEVSVQAEPSFLKIYSDTVTSDKFTGTMSELPYIVSGSELHGGLNYGRIRLNTFNQTLNHEVVAARQNDTSNPSPLRHHRNIIMDITRCYLNYRMKRIDSSDWIETTNKLIQRLRGYETDTPYYKLIQAQVMVAMGQAEECGWLLESARSEIDQKDVVLYCYYLYVNSLAKKDSSYTSQAAGIIKQYYENGNDDWRILWLLFYIDKDFNHNQSAKLIRIKDAYQAGCKS